MRRMGIALAFLVAGGVAHAQTTPSYIKGDETFAKQAAASGLAEVKLSQLAIDKAQSLEVKQLARKMVMDHTKANTELKQIADQQNMKLPTELDAKQQQTFDELSKLSGSAFDREYVRLMSADHDATVVKFQHEGLYGQDPELKSFAMKTLPLIEKHDRLVHADAAKLK
jgi:putative membrane protein